MNVSNDNVQYITSTNYPDNYPDNQDCLWEINVDAGYIIALTFEDFQTEDCDFDYVELAETKSNITKLIKKLCFTQGVNNTYFSTGSRMLLKFHSDGSKSFKGFKASFKPGISELLLNA